MSNRSSSNHGDYAVIWSKYHPGFRPSGLSLDGSSVFIDPHIISTPFITDFNGDGSEDELVIATNFYFEERRLATLHSSRCHVKQCSLLWEKKARPIA